MYVVGHNQYFSQKLQQIRPIGTGMTKKNSTCRKRQLVVFIFLTILISMITFKKLHIYTTISRKYLTRTSRKSTVIPTVQTHALPIDYMFALWNSMILIQILDSQFPEVIIFLIKWILKDILLGGHKFCVYTHLTFANLWK